MDLKEYFTSLCRETAVKLKINSPGFKFLVSGKKKRRTGINATFGDKDFSFTIHYIESGKGSYAQQTLWISLAMENEPLVILSVYDILAFLQSEDLSCHTYIFVDSPELMRECFNEITELLQTLLPEFRDICGDGTKRNKLIASAKEKLNLYFGDSILETGELLGSRADKLVSMMLYNYFQYQIETAVIGNQALFHQGKEEKALAGLKKAKYRSLYEDMLFEYITNGGKAPKPTETVVKASSKTGLKRHGGGAKGAFTFLGNVFLFAIPFSAIIALIYFILVYITARDALFILGIKENLLFLLPAPLLAGIAASVNLLMPRSKKRKKKGNKQQSEIQEPPASPASKAIVKWFTIAVETFVLIYIWICVNSTAAVYDNGILYSTDDFPLSRTMCEFSSVDYGAIVEGYYIENEFQKEPYLAFVTKSGDKLDLYSSTFLSTKNITKDVVPYLESKGIEIKKIKSLE